LRSFKFNFPFLGDFPCGTTRSLAPLQSAKRAAFQNHLISNSSPRLDLNFSHPVFSSLFFSKLQFFIILYGETADRSVSLLAESLSQ
jgi:hypothetical protein